AVDGIFFDTGSAALRPESGDALAAVAQLLADRPSLALHVVGHTDSVGEFDDNLDLSRRRAAAVVAALVEGFAIDPARLTANGVGALAPVASNRSPAGRALNRRVELVERP
ncbi:MAG: OmpA family protein, partial [Alphaproteobacteria bacterium]